MNAMKTNEFLTLYFPDHNIEGISKVHFERINRFNAAVYDIFEPIESALIVDNQFFNAIFITKDYIGILIEELITGFVIHKKSRKEFDRFEFGFLHLCVCFTDGIKYKLGMCVNTPDNENIIRTYTTIIKTENMHANNKERTEYKLGNTILQFEEDKKMIRYGDICINNDDIRQVRLLVDEKRDSQRFIANEKYYYDGKSVYEMTSVPDRFVNSVVITVQTVQTPRIDITVFNRRISVFDEQFKEVSNVYNGIMNRFNAIVRDNNGN